MHSMGIMHTDPYDKKHHYPEAFDVAHNGDFSGSVQISMESWHVDMLYEADSQFARHGNAIVQVEIPFEVLAEIVATAVQQHKVSKLEQAGWQEVLGLR